MAESPRIENGVLCWYEGDRFRLSLSFTLTDKQSQQPITIGAGDTVTVEFSDQWDNKVKTFSFPPSGGTISQNTVTLDFDSATTLIFRKGRYKYSAILETNFGTAFSYRITLEDGKEVLVE